MTKTCNRCHQQINEDDYFCPYCGESLLNSRSEVPPFPGEQPEVRKTEPQAPASPPVSHHPQLLTYLSAASLTAGVLALAMTFIPGLIVNNSLIPGNETILTYLWQGDHPVLFMLWTICLELAAAALILFSFHYVFHRPPSRMEAGAGMLGSLLLLLGNLIFYFMGSTRQIWGMTVSSEASYNIGGWLTLLMAAAALGCFIADFMLVNGSLDQERY